MKTMLLITLLLLPACYSKRIETLEANQKKIAQSADQNFTSQANHIQNLLNKVFAENIEKAKAKNCEKGFSYLTGECL